jgi:hypothetical protein
MRATDRRRGVTGVAIIVALLVGYVGASYGSSMGAAGATDTTPPTDTTPATDTTPTPSPDPAPPAPKPAPKPMPKPVSQPGHAPKPVSQPARVHHAPKPVSHPARVYHAPPPAPTPTTTPRVTNSPPAVVHHAKPKAVHHRKQKRKKRVVHVKSAPTARTQAPPNLQAPPDPQAQPKQNVVAPIPVAITPKSGKNTSSGLLFAGVALAALLFFIVWAVPTTPARYTHAGRVVIDHQVDLLLAGVGTLLVTAMVFLLTRGS